jgi:polysaccharide export outer membrane protein
MRAKSPIHLKLALWFVVATCATCTGCLTPHMANGPTFNRLPAELIKQALPTYVIEPPDILQIDALRIIPLPPYKIEPLDILLIEVTGTDPRYPVSGTYQIGPEGTVNLGVYYGNIRVAGMTLDDAKTEVEARMKDRGAKNPRATVSLYQGRGKQAISGEHLVRPDGTVGLGTYGSVFVAGLTLAQAKDAIEDHLSRFLLEPEVAIDVLAFNSKVFYLITDGAGLGETIARLPITGNETVLDVLSQGGLPQQASKKNIWIARPAPPGTGPDQILPVDYTAIVKCGQTATNYQVMPGDRIYIQANPLFTVNNWINTIAAPIERLFGVALLGQTSVQALENPNRFFGNGFGGFGF